MSAGDTPRVATGGGDTPREATGGGDALRPKATSAAPRGRCLCGLST